MGLERLLRVKNVFMGLPLLFAIGCQDYNVNAIPDPCEPCEDVDNDNYFGGSDCPVECIDDCDDNDSKVNPAAIEDCMTEYDDNCNEDTEDFIEFTSFLDYDLDGWGDETRTIVDCIIPDGYVSTAGDCDDLIPEINPDAIEMCNGYDDNCNGQVDEEEEEVGELFNLDSDGDGFGGSETGRFCEQPEGYVTNSDDCDDSQITVYPGAEETCDDLDNDCNEIIDDVEGGCDWIDYDNFDDNSLNSSLWRVLQAECYEGGCSSNPCVEEDQSLYCQASFTGPNDTYILKFATVDENGVPGYNFASASAVRFELLSLRNILGANCAGTNDITFSFRDETGNTANFYEVFSSVDGEISSAGLFELYKDSGDWEAFLEGSSLGIIDTSSLDPSSEWSLQFGAELYSTPSCQTSCYGTFRIDTLQYIL